MNSTLIGSILFAALVAAVLLGRRVRRHLPEDHLSADSRDAVKLAVGLVATMTALLLGLLVSSAKGTYDNQRSQIIVMASKVAFLGRVLNAYGPEADGALAEVRAAVLDGVHRMWPGARGKMKRTVTATSFAVIAPTLHPSGMRWPQNNRKSHTAAVRPLGRWHISGEITHSPTTTRIQRTSP